MLPSAQRGTCPICMCAINEGLKRPVALVPCGHIMCNECVRTLQEEAFNLESTLALAKRTRSQSAQPLDPVAEEFDINKAVGNTKITCSVCKNRASPLPLFVL
mmetsp:Transcript_31072/g.99216  ORF Transcript_31072/g.99216 Transcript_31072/m.99216 type:complete len:103 (-) Transcript_31072:1080-1388(-)